MGYSVFTEGNGEYKFEVIDAQALDIFHADAYITISNGAGEHIYRGEVKDALVALSGLPAGMRRSVQGDKTYTTYIGAPSWIANEATQFERDYMDMATAALGNR